LQNLFAATYYLGKGRIIYQYCYEILLIQLFKVRRTEVLQAEKKWHNRWCHEI